MLTARCLRNSLTDIDTVQSLCTQPLIHVALRVNSANALLFVTVIKGLIASVGACRSAAAEPRIRSPGWDRAALGVAAPLRRHVTSSVSMIFDVAANGSR